MKEKTYTDLRKEAELRLRSDTIDIKRLSDEEVRSLAHELQVHQIELEMQNEELHKAQLQVEELLRKYSDLYNFAPVGYFTTNEKGLILETNLRGASMLGIARSLLIKKYLTVVKEDQDTYYLHRRKCLETGNRGRCELRIAINGGGQFFALLESIAVRDADDNYNRIRTIVTDITERKEMMSALQQSEEQYRTLVQTIPDIIYKVDENGFFTFLNNSVRTLGYESEDLIGKHFSTIVHPKDVKSYSRFMILKECSGKDSDGKDTPKLFDERRTNKRMTRSLRLRLVPKSNDSLKTHVPGSSTTITFGEITATEIYLDKEVDKNRGFHGTVGIISDITDKIKLQQEVVRAGQLALIGEMAAGLAHEINNPVYGIINFAQLIVDESDKNSRIHKFGKLIMEEGSRIADLTRNLLTLSRDKTNEKRSIQIDELITSSLKLSETQLKKDKIIIKVNIPEDVLTIFADPQEMQQLFLNLIQNARYALNEKYSGKDKEKILEISCKKTSTDGCEYCRIIFHDRGSGIPESILNNITSPFFTTKPPSKGTGIGLSICNSIINNCNGKMVIESEHGIFTRVIIDLPAKKLEIKE